MSLGGLARNPTSPQGPPPHAHVHTPGSNTRKPTPSPMSPRYHSGRSICDGSFKAARGAPPVQGEPRWPAKRRSLETTFQNEGSWQGSRRAGKASGAPTSASHAQHVNQDPKLYPTHTLWARQSGEAGGRDRHRMRSSGESLPRRKL